ncbi:MAG TPA: tetratricopeptide repeat protein [Candidatus Sulfotelmatobacter sp.]|nr:tetratricopeptide repeat protein [Candidatus Sulfotelmatobacter sp.]
MVERVKPRSLYVEEGIQLALESRWEEALAVNQQLIERHGADEDTYNRLGKAYFELGRLKEASDAYAESLKLNPLNIIAQKNARKLAALLESAEQVTSSSQAIAPDLFAEEPGKSALTMLVSADPAATPSLAPGDTLELEPQDSVLQARTTAGSLLGEVEPRLARRLVPLMRTGNRYNAVVARIEDERVEVMIREVYQSPENARKASFPTSRAAKGTDFRPYAKESLLASRGVEAPAFETDEEAAPTDVEEVEDEVTEAPAETAEIEEDTGLEDGDVDEDVRPEDEY